VANDYNILMFQECPKCKEYEPDYVFTDCSFDVKHGSDGKAIQVFECTRCHYKWEKKYK
jgi:hypothetical protein